MQLQRIWSGFSEEQYEYITDIVANSDAKSVCEIGTFVGTTAQKIWENKRFGQKTLSHRQLYVLTRKQESKVF